MSFIKKMRNILHLLLLTATSYVCSLRLAEFIGGSSDGWRAIAGLPSVISIDGNGAAMLSVNSSTSPSFFMAPNEILMDIVYRSSFLNISSHNFSLRVLLNFPSICTIEPCVSRLILVGETCSLDMTLSRGENVIQLWPYQKRDGFECSLCSALLEPDHLCEENDPANASSRILQTLRFLLVSIEAPAATTPATFSLSAAELLPAQTCPPPDGPCAGGLSVGLGVSDWLALSDFPPLETCTAPPVKQAGG